MAIGRDGTVVPGISTAESTDEAVYSERVHSQQRKHDQRGITQEGSIKRGQQAWTLQAHSPKHVALNTGSSATAVPSPTIESKNGASHNYEVYNHHQQQHVANVSAKHAELKAMRQTCLEQMAQAQHEWSALNRLGGNR